MTQILHFKVCLKNDMQKKKSLENDKKCDLS